MSIVLHHVSVHAPRAAEALPSTTPTAPRPDPATEQGPAAGGSARHALIDALASALSTLAPGAAAAAPPAGGTGDAASGGTPSNDVGAALHRFTHELLSLLRPSGSDAPGNGHGRGYAWGRATAGDLAGRLEALVQRLQSGAGATPPTPPSADTPTTPPAPAAPAGAPPVDGTAGSTPATLPAEPPPTALPAAAPSALLAAFEQLAAASGGDTAGAVAASTDRLAAFLHTVAEALRGDAAADLPTTGSLLSLVG